MSDHFYFLTFTPACVALLLRSGCSVICVGLDIKRATVLEDTFRRYVLRNALR